MCIFLAKDPVGDVAEDLTNALTSQRSGNKYLQKCGKILTARKITHYEV